MAAPVVTIGIPTLNRPELLERRLGNVLGQAFGDFVAVVSDNCSPDRRVEEIGRRFAAADRRVRYVRQPQNIGAGRNFHFVLKQANTEYFIWAADDDLWDQDFLEVCLATIGGAQLHMPAMVGEYSDRTEAVPLPELALGLGAFENARRFIANMQPSILYGLHRTAALLAIFDGDTYDHSDVVLVYRAILADGVKTGGDSLYHAGMNGAAYTPKPVGLPGSEQTFSYRRFIRSMIAATWQADALTTVEKLQLSGQLSAVLGDLVDHLASVYPAISRTHHLAYHRARNSWRSLKDHAKRALGVKS